MDYYTNHCWCIDSIWGGHYDCRHIVTIKRNLKLEEVRGEPHIDWTNTIEKKDFFSQEKYDLIKEIWEEKSKPIDEESIRRLSTDYTYIIKPEMIKWLENNIKDRKGEDSDKGWTIGTDQYNSNAHSGFDIFFHRQKDALAFIKEFSIYKKPTDFFNYFRDIRKKLDFNTMKLVTVSSYEDTAKEDEIEIMSED